MTEPTDHEQWPRRIAIFGVGLLGGSVALSIRRKRPQSQIVGLVRDVDRGQALIDSNIVDRLTDSIDVASQESDCIVVATPVDRLADMVIGAAALSPDHCLITDVGSTKAEIVDSVQQNPEAAKKFVAAHPIAGSEKSGATNASATLFDDKRVVITPSESLSSNPQYQALVDRCTRFWTLTGCHTIVMSPQQHDVHLASVSHVPHLVSALVAKLADPSVGELTGSGWRDITRVAAGDPQMWTAICAANRPSILDQLDRFSDSLQQLRDIIRSGDDQQLHNWLAEAKEAKEQIR